MIELFKLDQELSFPSVSLALKEPNGLLAFGGDLSPERLMKGYREGIFPWFSEGEPLLWWSPDPRGVIFLDDFEPSKSLRKSLRKQGFTVTMNMAFNAVIEHCSKVPRHPINVDNVQHANTTWITNSMVLSYQTLHEQGFAHSVEVWGEDNTLVGGLYGIGINGAFCGESMFHLQTDASKAALWALVTQMRQFGLQFIDCQMVNPHLETLGCIDIPREKFLTLWHDACARKDADGCWAAQALSFE
ncbi:leucyl/phenylalanyl-tRNA--protein transferase [Glaciecola sp. XM2]|jgi:leucyl/phenylalanyl-tRNA--protein transferase|uniref:leucyl/phenylalanyl-tRNA--protein transferase n=1 Tax=Glaciecola sp. XM2 TaxID=1914931 RepID=UPI001BDED1C3|nr:leucyl/phenylalanyl-tRNA--protein transferase [Glaciecola sp. XM2]MBT1449372.1 leucyl/phenylalanyl-tRNA--protein transferase [Glaciecola sp. XM2]